MNIQIYPDRNQENISILIRLKKVVIRLWETSSFWVDTLCRKKKEKTHPTRNYYK